MTGARDVLTWAVELDPRRRTCRRASWNWCRDWLLASESRQAAAALEMSALSAWRLAHRAVELGTVEGAQIRCGGSSLRLSWLVNLTILRDDGCHWDLQQSAHKRELEQLQAHGEVEILFGSSLSRSEGEKLTEVYLKQLEKGKHFVHKQLAEVECQNWRGLKLKECQDRSSSTSLQVQRWQKC
eukprot:984079-Amphidinium_carterae.1